MSDEFIGGLKISESFFHEQAEPILAKNFPALKYSAALIGSGSEVLGVDTSISTDHDWRPRFFIFLDDQDFLLLGKDVEKCLRKNLPDTYKDFKTKIQTEKAGDLRSKFVYTNKTFLKKYLGRELIENLSCLDWLTFDEHRLLGLTSGKVFRDDSGQLTALREKFVHYPLDVWRYQIASEWMKIAEEEAFVGRAGEVGDELGSKIIATRIVQSLMRLCFLFEKRYAPYSKWFGTGFTKLSAASQLVPMFQNVLDAKVWREREQALSVAYEKMVELLNALKLTPALPTKVKNFHDRPYLVIGAGEIASAIQATIQDDKLKKVPLIGSLNQFSDSVVLIENDRLRNKLKALYR